MGDYTNRQDKAIRPVSEEHGQKPPKPPQVKPNSVPPPPPKPRAQK